MPQMSPMNWFFLFLYFNLGLFLLIVKMFYFSNKSIEHIKSNMEPSLNSSFSLLL